MKILNSTDNDILEAAELIIAGKVVAFPTETIYGIGANIFDTNAVDTIFQIKNRNYNKPLAAHISNINMVEMVSPIIPDIFYELAQIFLPGPLTMIIPAKASLPPIVTANTQTIAIRFPSNPVCKKFIDNVGSPIAGTSANISGEQAAVNPAEITQELEKHIAAIIDDGECLLKKESTVISLVGTPTIIREGAIKIITIEGKIGKKLFKQN
jgi:L-threonylcarbamoyladenylate synthase